MRKPPKYQLVEVPIADTPSETLFQERELGSTHLSFRVEMMLCNAIKDGNAELLEELLEETLSEEIVTGHLSKNPVTQMKYWCVTVIATAIHYAILGGLDETDAYNLSDEYIQTIDSFTHSDACIDYLCDKAKELVHAVSKAKHSSNFSSHIKKALHYIHIHLHEKITIDMLATQVNLSRDYLSVLFLKETGSTIHSYILKEKLEEAQKMLIAGKSINEISYILAFSSQSHFTAVFKKAFGITPSAYQRQYG